MSAQPAEPLAAPERVALRLGLTAVYITREQLAQAEANNNTERKKP